MVKFPLFNKIRKRKKSEKKIDYLHLTKKEKFNLILRYQLKWLIALVGVEAIIGVILQYTTSFSGYYFFTRWILYFSAFLLIFGGCFGGLTRYHVPPKMRIIEPDDQSVVPPNFEIRVKYDPSKVQKETIKVFVNHKSVPTQFSKKEKNTILIPKIFKSPPKKAVSLLIQAKAKSFDNKEITDKIRIIYDPEADMEDYIEYWEFKREDDTYWGKEMISAQKHAKRMILANNMIILATLLLLINFIIAVIYKALV